MIWLISDTHFNHDKKFIYGPRGFHSVQEADSAIIKNWNDAIGKDDEVYMLGDFFLGTDYDFITNTINTLNGRIHLVIGNHDTPAKVEFYKKFDNIVEISWSTQIEYNKRQFYLSHYPTQTADLNSDPKTCVFNIYGHVHSKEKFYEDRPYMYCVALDAQDNKPVSIEQVYQEIRDEIKDCIRFLV